MKLTNQQRNVLESIVEQTCFRSGPRKGAVKARIDASKTFDGRTLIALSQRGLIDCSEGSAGTGVAETKAGFEMIRPTRGQPGPALLSQRFRLGA